MISSMPVFHYANKVAALLLVQVMMLHPYNTSSAFTIPSKLKRSTAYEYNLSNHGNEKLTQLSAQKQSRSSLLKPPQSKTKAKEKKTEEVKEEIYGTKFFGGSSIKEELFDAELEERADKMLKLYPPKQTVADTEGKEDDDDIKDQFTYYRFMDTDAFPDEKARLVAQRLQSVINQALYIPEDGEENDIQMSKTLYSPTLQWNTPFTRDSKSRTPLDELENALDFYKRIDVAIIAAKNTSMGGSGNNVQQMELRWEIALVWPNTFESTVLITGTSIVTVDTTSSTILSQTDKLDNGGKDGQDIIKAINPQLQPRFWDLYHIGMTPPTAMMPRLEPSKEGKGLFSSYDLFEIPPRLVSQPTIETSGGRDTREAQALPNHAFTSIIKTTGASAQRYVTTTPLEVSIRRTSNSDGEGSKSVISWNVALPPEFVSYYEEMTKVVTEEDKAEGNEPTNDFVYQPRRLVATMKYGGDAQDVEVTEIRKKLYEQVVKDGLKPKLGEEGRPQFFFLQNDTKACFTADGGLGMCVYEWRPKSANSNEVGIELEL